MPDRWADRLLAASIVGWAVAGLMSGGASLPGLVLLGLQCLVGLLLLIRSRSRHAATAGQVARSLPSLAIGFWGLSVAPPPSAWPAAAILTFATGALLAAVAFVALGRSFAILPAARQLVMRGPFRVVRHPGYAGQWLMLLACGIAAGTPVGLLPAIVAVPLLALRVGAEEEVLANVMPYAAYAHQVRWRFVPGVW